MRTTRLTSTLTSRVAIILMSATLMTGLFSALAMAQTTPVITGYSPGNNQTTLTITGSDFGSTSASVTIDNASATVVNWSNTSIEVDLSSTASPGTIAVTTSAGLTANATFPGVERGYYTLNAAGQVTAHGAIPTYGDLTTLSTPVSSPAIQLVPSPTGQGYWILTQNGTVYGFGDATNFGSVGSSITAVAMAANPSGTGVWVLSSTGTVYALGQAVNLGSAPVGTVAKAIATTADGNGYWILAKNGTVYPFGDAANLGSVSLTSTPTTHTTYPNGSLVQVDKQGPVFIVNGTTVYHVPTIAILKGMGHTIAQVKSVPNLNGYTIGPPMFVPYADGAVVKNKSNGTFYLVENGLLQPYASASVAQASHIPASRIVQVAALRANWPVGAPIKTPQIYILNGSLYRLDSTHGVYILDNGALDRIATAAVFNGMGLKWTAVQNVTNLPSYPAGTEITKPTPLLVDGSLWRVKTAVYLAENGVLRHIPTAAMFNSLGLSWPSINTIPSISGLNVGPAVGTTTIPAGTAPIIPAVSLVPSANSQGYWILLANGQIDPFGNAVSFGQLSTSQLGHAHALSLAVTPDGNGYSVLTTSGSSYSFGDALAGGQSANAVSLAMTALPSATVSSTAPSRFFSMAYGSFMPNYDGSYTTMVDNPKGLSAIIPTWYYEQQNPSTLSWGAGTPPQGFSSVVSQAHSEGVQVWPMVGSTSVGPFQSASAISSTVQQLVQNAVQNNYDGLTIDFEPSQFNGLSMSQASQQYTNFVAALGPALHAVGKKLMVDTYASFYPNSPYNLAAIAPYVNYINIMTYGHFDYATEAGPNAGLPWMQGVYQNAIAQGVNPSQIIMGFGPYGDYWSYNNSGLDQKAPLGSDNYVSDSQVSQLLLSNPNIVPIWDPTYQSEIFMTNEYVNAQGQWTVNTSGQAVAPTQTLSPSDEATFMPQVQNLQGLLNYILVRYAVENNQPVPSYLNLVQDGHYGPLTAEAVTQFQQDFGVAATTPGTYGPVTQSALNTVIQQWNLGEYQYWVDTTQSMQNRVQQVAVADNLGGMAVWRLPFETSDFWSALESTVAVQNAGQGGNTP